LAFPIALLGGLILLFWMLWRVALRRRTDLRDSDQIFWVAFVPSTIAIIGIIWLGSPDVRIWLDFLIVVGLITNSVFYFAIPRALRKRWDKPPQLEVRIRPRYPINGGVADAEAR
jgi:hypothetical protein